MPNHRVLSQSRARRGVEAFQRFFEQVVWLCVEAGLVDRRKIFVDVSLVDANTSNNSVMATQSLRVHLRGVYEKLEGRLGGPGRGRIAGGGIISLVVARVQFRET